MRFWFEKRPREERRPERVEAEMRLSCNYEDALNQGFFRILAHIKGRKDPAGYALITFRKGNPELGFILANLTVLYTLSGMWHRFAAYGLL